MIQEQFGTEQIKSAVHKVVEEYRANPIDLLNVGDGAGELNYLGLLSGSYVTTIAALVRRIPAPARILELGTFLGAVSVTLQRLGYELTASDIPEFVQNAALQRRLKAEGIPLIGSNLKDPLPFPSGQFDVVLMCEVLEHLNFNPLPALAEINRVLAPNGMLLIGTPNAARLSARIRLLLGKSINGPIQDYVLQLDPAGTRRNMIVGLHWREYTAAELRELLDATGFEVEYQCYRNDIFPAPRPLKSHFGRMIYRVCPFLSPFQLAIARKRQTIELKVSTSYPLI
jgi:SAM-dependent methyltransferase